MASVVGGMLTGADSIDDLDVLRSGATPELFDHVRAPSTIGSWLRAFSHRNLRQLDAVSRELRVRLWAAGAGPHRLDERPLVVHVIGRPGSTSDNLGIVPRQWCLVGVGRPGPQPHPGARHPRRSRAAPRHHRHHPPDPDRHLRQTRALGSPPAPADAPELALAAGAGLVPPADRRHSAADLTDQPLTAHDPRNPGEMDCG